MQVVLTSPGPVQRRQRITNCNNLQEFLKSIGTWDSLSPFEQGMILSKVWGVC